MKRQSGERVSAGTGGRCPRCNQAMARWRHADHWKPPIDRGYYTQWDQCMNKRCKTQQVMPAGVLVAVAEPATSPFKAEHAAALAHFRSI